MPSSTRPNPSRRPGTAALIFAAASLAVFIFTAFWVWFNAPDQVPSHFGANGQPDDWASKGEVFAWLVPLGVGLSVLLSIRSIFEKMPLSLVNIPHKEYWIQRGERVYLFDCLMEFMRITAGACALLFALSLVQTLSVGLGRSWPESLVFLPTGIFLAIVAIALWNLFRRLKPDVTND
ncbi:DUF1648 domain-containing protein [Brevibacterium aurantiacum]|uniref:DUF1648 domain-containing protein n=1 Tax=Brevibacterium aurantiacum TaxID=273384 RepID=UPI001F0A5093|nr:DUF1648 domain-containing protein [Brevibacterium aurantiacum]